MKYGCRRCIELGDMTLYDYDAGEVRIIGHIALCDEHARRIMFLEPRKE